MNALSLRSSCAARTAVSLPMGLLVAGLLLALPLAPPPAAAQEPPSPAAETPAEPAPSGEEFHFELLDTTYSQPDPQLAPVKNGPITVQLRSPSNSLQLHGHRLWLEPLANGNHRARLEVDFEGQGDLEADLDVSGMKSTFKDEVVIPRQEVVVEGEVRLERVEGGYLVTAVAVDEQVEMAIESKLATSLVTTCKSLTRFLPLGLPCGGLESSMSTAAVPLPGPESPYLLRDDLLTAVDRLQLAGYLAR